MSTEERSDFTANCAFCGKATDRTNIATDLFVCEECSSKKTDYEVVKWYIDSYTCYSGRFFKRAVSKCNFHPRHKDVVEKILRKLVEFSERHTQDYDDMVTMMVNIQNLENRIGMIKATNFKVDERLLADVEHFLKEVSSLNLDIFKGHNLYLFEIKECAQKLLQKLFPSKGFCPFCQSPIKSRSSDGLVDVCSKGHSYPSGMTLLENPKGKMVRIDISVKQETQD